jgi:hypothetical protein
MNGSRVDNGIVLSRLPIVCDSSPALHNAQQRDVNIENSGKKHTPYDVAQMSAQVNNNRGVFVKECVVLCFKKECIDR